MNRNNARPTRGGLMGNNRFGNQDARPNETNRGTAQNVRGGLVGSRYGPQDARANDMNRNVVQNTGGGMVGGRYGNQDARGNANFAVAPTAGQAKVLLKKGGVKIVAAAPRQAPPPAPAPAPPSAPAPTSVPAPRTPSVPSKLKEATTYASKSPLYCPGY